MEKDWLDHLLQEDGTSQQHIADAGFSGQVLAHLPTRRAGMTPWVVPVATMLGCVLGLYILGGAEYVFNAIAALVTEGELGLRQAGTLGALAVFYVIAVSGAWGER